MRLLGGCRRRTLAAVHHAIAALTLPRLHAIVRMGLASVGAWRSHDPNCSSIARPASARTSIAFSGLQLSHARAAGLRVSNPKRPLFVRAERIAVSATQLVVADQHLESMAGH